MARILILNRNKRWWHRSRVEDPCYMAFTTSIGHPVSKTITNSWHPDEANIIKSTCHRQNTINIALCSPMRSGMRHIVQRMNNQQSITFTNEMAPTLCSCKNNGFVNGQIFPRLRNINVTNMSLNDDNNSYVISSNQIQRGQTILDRGIAIDLDGIFKGRDPEWVVVGMPFQRNMSNWGFEFPKSIIQKLNTFLSVKSLVAVDKRIPTFPNMIKGQSSIE